MGLRSIRLGELLYSLMQQASQINHHKVSLFLHYDTQNEHFLNGGNFATAGSSAPVRTSSNSIITCPFRSIGEYSVEFEERYTWWLQVSCKDVFQRVEHVTFIAYNIDYDLRFKPAISP
jgi:hypothetical protein